MPYNAYTEKYDVVVKQLITKCLVGEPVAKLEPDMEFTTFRALWDTGATCSAISARVVMLLGLMPVSKETVTHAGGQSVVDIYSVGIVLPNNILVPLVDVFEGDFSSFDVLIGMDIISQCDFSVSNVGGKTTFSVRVPPYKETDFAGEYEDLTT